MVNLNVYLIYIDLCDGTACLNKNLITNKI